MKLREGIFNLYKQPKNGAQQIVPGGRGRGRFVDHNARGVTFEGGARAKMRGKKIGYLLKMPI